MDYEIKTKKCKSEVLKIIAENTNEVFKGDIFGDKYFGGNINDNTFKLWKYFTFNKFFSPILIGVVNEDANWSIIRIDCKYRMIDKIIICIWLIASGIACIVVPFLDVSHSVPIYSPYIIFIGGIILSTIPYRLELYSIIDKLNEMLKD